MSYACFLTGTDTEVGKTHIACALLHRARSAGHVAVGLKPVAAGTDATGANDDVVRIRAASSRQLPDAVVNPYCFAPAIAPHIAAADAGVVIDFARIAATVDTARTAADFVVVEGAGGFCVPFGVDRNAADLARQLALPVVLVVGMRLGCINHALLSAEAIAARGLPLAGWVANRLAPGMQRFAENLATLEQLLPAPCLGVVPWGTSPADAAACLDLPA
ncbi:dethiobiotin synthetase [Azonexus fungiphilus]|uniref:ATP-dependent dethiobiotin synthetase BioD n=1 Tax=Azonexus fungiphilus TaxID=146940 RepID=A0A495W910_9RHOO|nr:dethiobiotin synthase [Azonexus fungiphilus]RKT58241.1 dethiobiotin synthetase [Azonexus fungiphilus]